MGVVKSAEDEKLVSIIVPIYNRAQRIKVCIDSILAQSHPYIQLILVDDGSVDESYQICRAYASRDSRVVALHQENSGPARARNTGLANAAGEYICFVDSDDQIHPDFLVKMLSVMKQNDVCVVICKYIESSSPTYNWLYCKDNRHNIEDASKALTDALYERKRIGYCWGKLWKRSTIGELKFENYSYNEDVLFFTKALVNTKARVAFLDGVPLYHYYRNDNSITRTLKIENMNDALLVVNRIVDFTRNKNLCVYNAALHYLVLTAFFIYCNSGKRDKCRDVRSESEVLIRKYRKSVFFDSKSPLRTKTVCGLSFVSIKLVSYIYNALRKR